MPNKYPEKKGWRVPKQRYKISNWPEYNEALRQRGNIEVWLSDTAIENWYEKDRVNNGTGASKKFTDFAILMCHEIRQVFRLPLRQCEGFINSLFTLKKLPMRSPDYTTLSKRLAVLNIQSPRYKKTDSPETGVVAVAIDSTGLKRFGRDEWRQEKHKISAKRSWRKLHIAVDDKHIIHGAALTDRFVADESVVADLIEQIAIRVDCVTADGAYDSDAVYKTLSTQFPDADIVIPPHCKSVYQSHHHAQRNRNLQEIKTFGRMNWQRVRNYGKRNYSELAIQRYKRILGNTLHTRELPRQESEVMIGCGILNKMTGLGMPESYRIT